MKNNHTEFKSIKNLNIPKLKSKAKNNYDLIGQTFWQ